MVSYLLALVIHHLNQRGVVVGLGCQDGEDLALLVALLVLHGFVYLFKDYLQVLGVYCSFVLSDYLTDYLVLLFGHVLDGNLYLISRLTHELRFEG